MLNPLLASEIIYSICALSTLFGRERLEGPWFDISNGLFDVSVSLRPQHRFRVLAVTVHLCVGHIKIA